LDKLRAIFFDLDDTLCDSRSAFDAGLTAAFDTILAQQGPDLDRKRLHGVWREVHGPLFADLSAGRMNMAQVRGERFVRLLRQIGMEEDGTLSAELNAILGRVQLQHLRLFEETALLDRLRPRYPVGIVTNGADDSHPDSQRSKIVHLGLQERVDAVWISDSVGSRKPKAAIFHAAASALNVPYAQILFVGDSPEADICGAQAVGMKTAWLHRGSTWPAEITTLQPDYVLDSLAGLQTLLEI
jgi:FMN phosphatase YigB (HAD superfamily)